MEPSVSGCSNVCCSPRFQVFTLHSDMQTLDQKKAMKPSPPGVRKIVSEHTYVQST